MQTNFGDTTLVSRAMLGAAFAAAAIPRLLYLGYAAPFFTTEYWQLAGHLIADGRLGFDEGRTTAYEPLYPLFLAAVRMLAADRVVVVQAAQALVASAGAIWLYLLTTDLTSSRRTAACAAALFALDPLLIRHAVSPSEFALLSTVLLVFAWRFVTARSAWRGAAAGLWLGLAILTRTMVLPLAAVAGARLARRGPRGAALACTATALLLAAPLAIRNDRVNGSMLPTRSGENLFIGNSKYSAALIPDHSPDILQEHARAIARRHGIEVTETGYRDEQAANVLFTRLAIDELTEHPREIFWLKVRNVVYFLSPGLVPRYVHTEDTTIALGPGKSFRIDHARSRPLAEHLVYGAWQVFVLAAACVGVWRRRGEVARDLILWAALLTFVLAAAVYFPATRYRVPVEFVLLFYAAVGAAGPRSSTIDFGPRTVVF